MQRVLEQEWLDVLPPDDARARRSRADLRRVNFVMGNARHIARVLFKELRTATPRSPKTLATPLSGGPTVADIGAGDGSLMRAIASRIGEVQITLVDRAPVADAAMGATVIAEDAHAHLARPGPQFDAIVANLFLHHFEDAPLARLLARVAQRTRLFVACEPRRTRFALHASRLLWLLGCNDVTRHDALASVRAGFRDAELSRLWPPEPGWRLEERAAPPFSHLFVARRDAL